VYEISIEAHGKDKVLRSGFTSYPQAITQMRWLAFEKLKPGGYAELHPVENSENVLLVWGQLAQSEGELARNCEGSALMTEVVVAKAV